MQNWPWKRLTNTSVVENGKRREKTMQKRFGWVLPNLSNVAWGSHSCCISWLHRGPEMRVRVNKCFDVQFLRAVTSLEREHFKRGWFCFCCNKGETKKQNLCWWMADGNTIWHLGFCVLMYFLTAWKRSLPRPKLDFPAVFSMMQFLKGFCSTCKVCCPQLLSFGQSTCTTRSWEAQKLDILVMFRMLKAKFKTRLIWLSITYGSSSRKRIFFPAWKKQVWQSGGRTSGPMDVVTRCIMTVTTRALEVWGIQSAAA